jgi:hypothetical protein
MIFDTQDYLGQLPPLVFRHEGREWQGRLLSVPQWIAAMYRAEQVEKAGNIVHTLANYRELADLMFPPKLLGTRTRRTWYGRRYEEPIRDPAVPSVADVLEGLPFAVQRELIADFIASQANALAFKIRPPKMRVAASELGPTTELENSTTTDGA